MPDRHLDLGSFLERSFRLLQNEVPLAFDRLLASVPATLLVEIDDERVVVSRQGSRLVLNPPGAPTAVVLRTSQPSLLDLLDGRAELLDLVMSDRVLLRGSAADLATTFEAFVAYFQGAVRGPGFPELLAEWRRPRSESAGSGA